MSVTRTYELNVCLSRKCESHQNACHATKKVSRRRMTSLLLNENPCLIISPGQYCIKVAKLPNVDLVLTKVYFCA